MTDDPLQQPDDLNIPDPDALVNQLDMLVTAAEGASARKESRPSSQGTLLLKEKKSRPTSQGTLLLL